MTKIASECGIHPVQLSPGRNLPWTTLMQDVLTSERMWSRNERPAIIEAESKQISLRMQARILRLNRSSIYYNPVEIFETKVKRKHLMDEIYADHPVCEVPESRKNPVLRALISIESMCSIACERWTLQVSASVRIWANATCNTRFIRIYYVMGSVGLMSLFFVF